MVIHTVQPGENVYSIAQRYGISYQRIIFDNQLSFTPTLVVGQSLLVLLPEITHQVRPGDTLYSISDLYGVSVMDILRNNPYLLGTQLYLGESIVIKYQDEKVSNYEVKVNGYAYPYIDKNILRESLLYLSDLSIFSYGFTSDGTLVPTNDDELISTAKEFGVSPILVLTPLDENGNFNSYLVTVISRNEQVRQNLINNLLDMVKTKGYDGVNVDFEYISPQDKEPYIEFVSELTNVMNREGYRVSVALAPKSSSEQPGLLYEGIDYKGLGENSNSVLVMTYEWGYTYGPPLAVAPVDQVRKVIEYAVAQIPNEKVDMGIPNYGYDWPLPYVRGTTEATVVGNVEAVEIALKNNVTIEFDRTSMAPYFYYSENGINHVVWFEDARSLEAKFKVINDFDLRGIGYWNLIKPFRTNWLLLNYLFNIY